MAVTHLPLRFDADIVIQSGVIEIFLKFNMAAAAILDFPVIYTTVLHQTYGSKNTTN